MLIFLICFQPLRHAWRPYEEKEYRAFVQYRLSVLYEAGYVKEPNPHPQLIKKYTLPEGIRVKGDPGFRIPSNKWNRTPHEGMIVDSSHTWAAMMKDLQQARVISFDTEWHFHETYISKFFNFILFFTAVETRALFLVKLILYMFL